MKKTSVIFTIAATVLCGWLVQEPAQADVIFDSWNLDVVSSNPPILPVFNLTSSRQITQIEDYHWNGGGGSDPTGGTISIYDNDTNALIGSWTTTSSNANTSWLAYPNVTLGPGNYRVVDSQPSTWSYSTTDYYGGLGRDGQNWQPNVGFTIVTAAPIDPFSGSSLGSGWYYSVWFGYYNSGYYPWAYHSDLGFVYVSTSDNTNLYLYVVNGNAAIPGLGASMGWLYTNPSIFPNVYSFSEGAWLYHAAGGTSFYNYTTQSWETY